MAFGKIQFFVQKPVSLPGSTSSRFEAVPVDMTSFGAINGTGYSQYKASLSYIGQFGAMKTLDLVASGPNQTAEVTFIDWLQFPQCNPL
jgi:hypothetical protein